MSCLSKCLFQWDEADYQLLAKTKRDELIRAELTNPSESAIQKATTKLELARHCRRRTRGAIESAKLIETLLLSLSVATDSLGVRLFRKDMMEVWAVLKCHLPCLQDPPNVSLYTTVGYITKRWRAFTNATLCKRNQLFGIFSLTPCKVKNSVFIIIVATCHYCVPTI